MQSLAIVFKKTVLQINNVGNGLKPFPTQKRFVKFYSAKNNCRDDSPTVIKKNVVHGIKSIAYKKTILKRYRF
jgi:hypothetical protein